MNQILFGGLPPNPFQKQRYEVQNPKWIECNIIVLIEYKFDLEI